MTLATGTAALARTDLSTDALREALLDDFETSATRRRGLPGEVRLEERGLLAYRSDVNSPDVNEVARARLAGRLGDPGPGAVDEGADAIEAAIAETIALFEWRPFLWWLRPDDTPADLADRLTRHGLVFLDDIPGMAMDLADLADETEAPPPPELDIQPVLDEAALEAFHGVTTQGFPEDWDDARAIDVVGSGMQAIAAEHGYREPNGVPTRWLGRVDGRAVATARLHAGAGVAGIYTVITVADARRRGYGEAMTRRAMLAGREAGLQISTLQASDAGRGVYERLGFREICRFRLFEWRPKSPGGNG
jgi:ribosomal protein S18 acetylase RimI-like enzyme